MKEEVQKGRVINTKWWIIPSFLLAVMGFILSTTTKDEKSLRVTYDPATTKHYVNGLLWDLPVKVLHFRVNPSVSKNAVVDLKGADLNEIFDVQVTAIRDVISPLEVPLVSVKAISTNGILYDLTDKNNVLIKRPRECVLYFMVTGY